MYYHYQVDNREEGVGILPLVMLPGQHREVTGVAWCPSQLSKVRLDDVIIECVKPNTIMY